MLLQSDRTASWKVVEPPTEVRTHEMLDLWQAERECWPCLCFALKPMREIGQEGSEWKGKEKQRRGRCKQGKMRVCSRGKGADKENRTRW